MLTVSSALKGSDHLDFIIDHRLFKPISTAEVEALYDRIAPGMQDSFEFVTRSQLEEGDVKKEQLVLKAGAHVDVSKSLDVPELSGEVERAVWQVEQASLKAEKEQEEKDQRGTQQVTVNEKNEQRK